MHLETTSTSSHYYRRVHWNGIDGWNSVSECAILWNQLKNPNNYKTKRIISEPLGGDAVLCRNLVRQWGLLKKYIISDETESQVYLKLKWFKLNWQTMPGSI